MLSYPAIVDASKRVWCSIMEPSTSKTLINTERWKLYRIELRISLLETTSSSIKFYQERYFENRFRFNGLAVNESGSWRPYTGLNLDFIDQVVFQLFEKKNYHDRYF